MIAHLRYVAAAAVLLAPGAALAQASGDGFQGPRIFNDQALDQSLAAMNRETQLSYTQKDVIRGLTTPETPDFMTLAAAIGADAVVLEDAPSMPVINFAETVSGDASLDAKLASMSQSLSDVDAHLFVHVARLSSGDLDDRLDNAEVVITSFGPAIDGDETLQAKVVHVTDLISPADTDRAVSIETSALAFTDATLQRYTAALATPPTDL